jgi:hypothetical protein
MSRSFTTYWTAAPWEDGALGLVDHAASNEFTTRGVAPGDKLFIFHYAQRSLFLGAILRVDRICTQAEAAAELGVEMDEIWEARDHVLAKPTELQRLNPDRKVPVEILRGLTFITADGSQTGLKFDADGAPNQQTLRTVRELDVTSAASLRSLIAWEGTPGVAEVLSIALSRGPGFGLNPVYTVVYSADGVAAWDGKSCVDRVGPHVGELPGGSFTAIADLAISSGFFDLDDYYPPSGTDLPSCKIAITTGARDTLVEMWGQSEALAFASVAAQIDLTADSITWSPLFESEESDS